MSRYRVTAPIRVHGVPFATGTELYLCAADAQLEEVAPNLEELPQLLNEQPAAGATSIVPGSAPAPAQES